MLVIEIKDFIKSHKFGVSAAELKKRFPSKEDALRHFIDQWLYEGRLKKFENEACCSSKKICGSCSSLAFEFYSWIKD